MRAIASTALPAFAVLTLLSSGCGLLPGGTRTATPRPSAPAAEIDSRPVEDQATEVITAEAPFATPVNVFGEWEAPLPLAHAAPVLAGNRGSFQQHTSSEEGYDADVVADPAGQWLSFSSTRHSDRADIYLQKVGGQSVVQLTTDPADDVQPAFSPDGSRIAFASSRSGTWDIYLMDTDGRQVELVVGTRAHEMHPSFSPDGKRLVYCALPPRGGDWELWVIDLATQQRRIIGRGLFPAWSPRKDMDRIAFQRSRQRGSRWFSVWTVDLVDGEPRRLTELAVSSAAAAVTPCWSPDGSRLAFTTIIEPDRISGRTGRRDVWVVNADGSGKQRLTEGRGTNLSPFWAAGQHLYFISDRSGHENIWSMKIDPPAGFIAAPGHANPPPQPTNGNGVPPDSAQSNLISPDH
jgi:TolB protein